MVLSLLSFRGSSHGGQSDWLAPQMGLLAAVDLHVPTSLIFNGELEHDETGKGRGQPMGNGADGACLPITAVRGQQHAGERVGIWLQSNAMEYALVLVGCCDSKSVRPCHGRHAWYCTVLLIQVRGDAPHLAGYLRSEV